MQNRGDSPEQVQRGSGGVVRSSGISKMQVAIIIVCAIVVSVIAVNMFLVPKLVSKTDFTTNLQNMNTTIEKTKTDLTQAVQAVQNTVNSLPNAISGQVTDAVNKATAPVNAQINAMQTQVSGMAGTVGNAATKNDISGLTNTIGQVNTNVTNLQKQIAADEATITSLTTRITALESKLTPPSGTSGSGGAKGVIDIKADVLEEGVLQSDNRTYSEIKLTITNLTGNALEDISISAMVVIENGLTSLRPTLSTSSWYVRDWDGNNLEVRSSSGYTLDANQVKKVYLNVYSWAYDYQQGHTTFTDISSSDVEVRTYSVK
jgi:cell division protein FtsL